jgi:DNA polymerase elongation subunit (family B)
VGKELQLIVFNAILDGRGKEEVEGIYSEWRRRIRSVFSPEQISFPIAMNREEESYKKTIPIHVQAVLNAKAREKIEINAGEKFYYAFIVAPFKGVIAFKKKLYPGYKLDYDRHIERIIENKRETIFEAMGWNKAGKQATLFG